MMTCVSDRSGIASSRMFFMQYQPPAIATAVRARTRNLLWADQAIVFLIMGGSVLVLAGHDEGLQLGFGIDEEVGGRHHLLAFPDARKDLVVAVGLPPHAHLARLDAPLAGVDEDELAYPAVEQRPLRQGERDAEVRLDRGV